MSIDKHLFNALPREVMSNASALLNTIKQVGTSVGVTIITSIMQYRNTFNYASISSQAGSFNPNSMNLLDSLQGLLRYGGASSTDAYGGALAILYGIVSKQAFLQSLNDTMLVISVITLLIILPTLLLREDKRLDSSPAGMTME